MSELQQNYSESGKELSWNYKLLNNYDNRLYILYEYFK